jgi:hypothetical protein
VDVHNRKSTRQNGPRLSKALNYVETHDEKYIGHFFLRRVEFTLHGLAIELDRPNDNLLTVTFTMAPSDFEEASRVVKIMAGDIDPQ